MIGTYQIDDLTVIFETRSRLLPLGPGRIYGDDFLLDFAEFKEYDYSTVTIKNSERVISRLYLLLAEEVAPQIYLSKFTDGMLLQHYHSVGFVEGVKEAIELSKEIASINSAGTATIIELPDEKV